MSSCIIDFNKAQEFKKAVDKYLDETFKCLGLSKLEGVYLATLFEKDGVSLIDLTNCVNLDKANTTRVINLLEEKGYVFRKTDDKDNRKFKIFITDKAKNLKEFVLLKVEEFNKIAYNGLTKKEIDAFKLTLSKILSNLNLI
jgi:DNA-binding MarR family transcriptional regulator